MFLGQTATDPTKANKKKKLGNITADQLNSNQQVIPLTYFAGRRYISGQFFSPAYNQRTKDVKATTGKDETLTVAHVYFCDFGLGFAIGGRRPVDAIFKLILDSEIFWANNSGLFRDTDPFESISTNRGTFRIYWGLPNSPQDTLVFTAKGAIPIDPSFDPRNKSTWPEDSGSGQGGSGGEPITGHYDRHPAYRNQCYAVFKDWKLGKEKEQVPQIMMELQRGVPWFADNTYSPTDLNTLGLNSDERGVNLIGVLYDLLTDPIFGLGMADSALHRAGFEAALNAFKDFRISPMITSQDDAKTVIVQLLEYVDGFVRDNDGLLDVGFFAHGVIDRNSLPLLVDDDLDGPPNIPPAGFIDSDTTFFVSYADREHHYNDRPQKDDESAIRRLVGERRDNLQDRPWLTDKDLAKRFITEFGKMQRQPKQAGEILIKREWLDNAPTVGGGTFGPVREGDRFLFQSAKYGFETIFRLNELEWPEDKSGQAKLEVENERSEWSSIFIPPADPGVGDFIIEPIEITNKRVFELPSGELKTSKNPQVSILAQRPRVETLGFSVYASDDNTTFNLVSTQNRFATFAKVAIAYPNSTADLDTVTGFVVDLKGVDAEAIETQTDAQRDNNNLLIVTQRGEIMSAGQIQFLGSGRVKIYVKRKLYGSGKLAHFVDDNIWLVYRDRLTPIDSALFVPGATREFKLQPYTSLEVLDLTDVSSFSYNFFNAPSVGSVFNALLETTAGVAADNTPDARVVVKWSGVLDQDIFLFEIRFKKDGDANWQSFTVGADPSGNNVTDFEVTPTTSYLVNVRPINSYGEPGAWLVDDLTIVSATLAPFQVTGLQLVGAANAIDWNQPDFPFSWRLNSPSSTPDLGSPGLPDPLFDSYLVEIYAGEVSAQQVIDTVFKPIWKAVATDPNFVFRFVDNASVPGGPFPKITVAVWPRDIHKNVGAPGVLTVNNPPPDVPSAIVLTTTLTGVNFNWQNPDDDDLDHVEILRSTDPQDPNPELVGTEAYPSTAHVLNGTSSSPFYYWLREVDVFKQKSAAVLAGGGTPGALVGDVTISPNGGNINGPTPLALVCSATPTAAIYYRFDNVTPTSADFLYNPSAPPQMNATGDFSAIAFLASVYGNPTKVHFDLVANGLSTPVLSPAPGTYGSPTGQQVVAISVPNSPPAGTKIRVTTDGTDPSSTNGTLINAASGSITLGVGTTTVKAKAIAPGGYVDSAIVRGVYVVAQSGGGGGNATADAQLLPPPGTYYVDGAGNFPLYIGVATATPEASQRATKDGSQPTSGPAGNGSLIGNAGVAFGMTNSKTVKAIAFATGRTDSNVVSGDYQVLVGPDPNLQMRDPVLGPGSGTYSLKNCPIKSIGPKDDPSFIKRISFVLAVACPRGVIRWTSDGSTPTAGVSGHGNLIAASAGAIIFDVPVDGFPETITIKAIAYNRVNGFTDSNVVTFTITLTDN